MSRDSSPAATNPVSKPSITARGSVTSGGALLQVPTNTGGTEVRQETFSMRSRTTAKAASKGKAVDSLPTVTGGTEYRQKASR